MPSIKNASRKRCTSAVVLTIARPPAALTLLNAINPDSMVGCSPIATSSSAKFKEPILSVRFEVRTVRWRKTILTARPPISGEFEVECTEVLYDDNPEIQQKSGILQRYIQVQYRMHPYCSTYNTRTKYTCSLGVIFSHPVSTRTGDTALRWQNSRSTFAPQRPNSFSQSQGVFCGTKVSNH